MSTFNTGGGGGSRLDPTVADARYEVQLGLGRWPRFASTLRDARVIAALEAADRIIDRRDDRIVWRLADSR